MHTTCTSRFSPLSHPSSSKIISNRGVLVSQVLNKQKRPRSRLQKFRALNQIQENGLDEISSHLLKQFLVVQDAAVQQSQTGDSRGLLYPLTNALENTLKYLQGGLDYLHVPYSYGWSIIFLTIIVKIVTFPLTRKQVESAMSMQAVKPRVDAIKRRFGEDKDRIQQETARLYAKADINPLAGCLPSIATLPIFLGLYRSLTNVASEGLLDKEGFYWLPTLAGPTSVAARQAGSGLSWLYPFVDGQPPIGWDEASRYLVLPVLLVAIQYFSTSIISPPVDPNDENANTQKILVNFLPLFIGWFALNLPSGLSLYYFSNIALTSAQQIYFRKLGGIQIETVDLGPINKPGSGRRRGQRLSATEMELNLIAGYLAEIEKENEAVKQKRLAASPLASDQKKDAVGDVSQEEGSDKKQLEQEEEVVVVVGEEKQEVLVNQEQEEQKISQNGAFDDHTSVVKEIDRRCKRKKGVSVA